MSFFELFITALALSADAFAVSVCKGLSLKKASFSAYLCIGAWFGIFQGGMTYVGFLLGSAFENYINSFDHLVAFSLLSVIGINMFRSAFSSEHDNDLSDSVSFLTMLPLAVATSIDALAVGITFGILPNISIVTATLEIGVVTLLASATGVKIGAIFGQRYKKPAEALGGLLLIAMGVKILLDHMLIL